MKKSYSMNLRAVVVLAFVLSAAPTLLADTLTINTVVNAYPGTDTQFFGQSVTTPGGGPWNNIQFNFYTTDTSATLGGPSAYGTLFLLTQEYLGLPGSLSSGTPGFAASTSTISGGVWIFDSSVVLLPGTQYFFLTTSPANPATSVALASGNPYSGGIVYRANATVPNYEKTLVGYDMAFRLQGTPTTAPVPESSAFNMVVIGGLLLLATQKSRWSLNGPEKDFGSR